MPNELTTQDQSSRAILTRLSPELRRLLVSEPDSDRALMIVADSPGMLREVVRALPALREAATEESGEVGVREVIGRRFALYPQPQRSDAEWSMWWMDYYDVLADVPRSALEAAMSAWVRMPESRFLPKPGELRALARRTQAREILAYERASRAAARRPALDPASFVGRAAVDEAIRGSAPEMPR